MKAKKRKSALVVEGGGMRSLFAAGVLHAFGEAGFDPFDMYIGVSAGACNLASHLAGQNDRNYEINTRYSTTPNFISLWRFLGGGHYMDLDWLWKVTIREYRLNLKAIFKKLKKEKKEYIIVTTSAQTGKAMYLHPDEKSLEHLLKVSSSLPILYRNILEIDSEKATDGGIGDSIPVIEAYRRGAADITVIRSRPASYVKKDSRFSFIVAMFFRNYPRLVEAFRNRPRTYMEAVAFINNPPPKVRINEIAPPVDMAIGRATRNPRVLKAAYEAGADAGRKFIKRNAGL